MVVGNGFIARAFTESQYKFDDKIVFASGVSNSSANNDAGFERERALLKIYRSNKKKLIYFSTSSVFDKQRLLSPYVQHKINIERYIQEHFSNYIVYRLPIVVGKSTNPNTLTNYLYHCVESGKEIELHENACRYLMDVDDVVKYVSRTSYIDNLVINLNFNNGLSIKDLVVMFEQILGKKANISLVSKGDCYSIDNSVFVNLINENDTPCLDHETYVYSVINKYYGVADL